jgi:hypothetical protein
MLKRRFGSWNKALIAAGFTPGRVVNVSDEMLFQNLEEVWIKLGKQPKYHELKKPLSRFSGWTYENRFGSWNKALEKFVEVANADIAPSVTEIDTLIT